MYKMDIMKVKRINVYAFPYLTLIAFLVLFVTFLTFKSVYAINIQTFKDTLSDSAPGEYSNHTLQFTINTDVSPGGYITLTPDTGFTIPATSTFGVRNVELYVNGIPRLSTTTQDAVYDGVTVTTGSPGLIEYKFNTTSGVDMGDLIEFRIGNHTSNATIPGTYFSTSTGTTTLSADVGLLNPSTPGTKKIKLNISGGSEPAYANFVVAIIDSVTLGPVDTTEEIPPVRFNGAPSGEIGANTFIVEISLETDEIAVCKYSTVASTSYATMTNTFSTTGLIVHSEEVTVVPEISYTFYVRCIDDEGNFNTDDYLISFTTPPIPSGTPTDGDGPGGDGTGSGDEDTGSGSGTGGTSGGTSGGGSTSGGSSGSGGSGGGSSGGSGGGSGSSGGGSIEGTDLPYQSGDGQVIINGYAYPASTVNGLVDGTLVKSATANDDGKFTITINDIGRGVYTFGVYAVDKAGVKSSTFSTTFTISGSKTSTLSNINLAPSILVVPDPVDIGAPLTMSGYTIPNASVTVENQKEGLTVSKKIFTTTSDSDGKWSISVDTESFSRGTYKVRAKAEQTDGVKTDFSGYTFYGVGQNAQRPLSADLNVDGKVNLTDFSILLFWWDTDGGVSEPPADINQDGRVSLTDFSIMLFQWTG